MADITTDMVNSFFSLGKTAAKPKVVVAVKGPPRAPNTNYRPDFKLPKKSSLSSPISPGSEGSWTPHSQNDNAFFNGEELSDLDLNGLDDLTPPDPDAPTPAAFRGEDDDHIFENYSFEHEYPTDLPITSYHHEIVNTIENNSACVIFGPTGSGKTTQVPQYILDHYAKQRRYCNILVTQPRRIAAVSIAKRVCQERDCPLGSLIGYQIGRDKCVSEDTRLAYVTTGVLLQKLISAKNMNQFTHVIIDEVHERDKDTDFCLLVVRKLLRSNSRHVKVVLMSATLESDLFSRYFAMPIRGQLEGAPVFAVEGNIFPVQEYYLEDLASVGPLPDILLEEPEIAPEGYDLAAQIIVYLDYWERAGVSADTKVERGSVLIFLPGIAEISRMRDILIDKCANCRLCPIALHSDLKDDSHDKIFYKLTDGRRKVILSTNIAESSITVPDVKYVIDFCLTKCLISDPETNYQSLRLQWASKSSSTQRKGRAGRVSAGCCYRMVSRRFYEECMSDYGVPELQRCPLEQVVLQVKLLDLGAPKAILSLALQPPDIEDIERTVLLLKQVGALSTIMKGRRIDPYDGELTFIGKVLGTLPVDVRIGKLMVLGYVFGCLEECIVIGACLSLKSVFSKGFKQELTTYRHKMSWANGSSSDCLASMLAYRSWSEMKERNYGFEGEGGENTWCRKKGIVVPRIREVDALVKDLTERLKDLNVRTVCPLYRKNSGTPDDLLILKLVIAGAFYPNYFTSGDVDEVEANKIMSGHDPYKTVMIRGMPPNGAMYKSSIARLFRDCGKGKALYFEESRAYIEFDRPSTVHGATSTTILPAVYLALKMRHLRLPLNIYISRRTSQSASDPTFTHSNRLRTNRRAASLSANRMYGHQPRQISLPYKGYIEIASTQVVEAGHFWAQVSDQESASRVQLLQSSLNRNAGRDFQDVDASEVYQGYLCIALWDEDEQFYRAKVLSKHPNNEFEVMFLDFGNVSRVKLTSLKKITPQLLQLPFQAFEVMLCEIQPANMPDCPTGMWSHQANQRFTELVQNRNLVAKVYSQLHDVLRVDLYDTNTNQDIHINQILINEGLAQFMEESFASKVAHQQADTMRSDEPQVEDNTAWVESNAEEMHNPSDNVHRVSLRGPFSPLELSFYSITCIGRLRAAKIEMDSVNSIALSDQPQDTHARLLVSANIGINASGQSVIARETTLMPNIHGLLPIVALTFAPCAELRTDPDKHQYTGALIGLGYDPRTNRPMLPDHDIELTFDVEINQNDVIIVNSLRQGINLAFSNEGMAAEWGTAAIRQIQTSCRQKIIELILKKREERKPYTFPKQYRWNQVEPDYVLPPNDSDTPELYQLHNGILISGASEDSDTPARVLERREKNEAFRQRAGRSSEPFPEPALCELCQVTCRHPRAVTLHLNSSCHREEEDILYDGMRY
ncbi:ATP-dependent RNA helicase TDRD9 isoform X1 [Nematostella vectensis]|nr:ATP-dependent RNA helicase TDRD9 isoform X1 [Nematostella vectensis]